MDNIHYITTSRYSCAPYCAAVTAIKGKRYEDGAKPLCDPNA